MGSDDPEDPTDPAAVAAAAADMQQQETQEAAGEETPEIVPLSPSLGSRSSLGIEYTQHPPYWGSGVSCLGSSGIVSTWDHLYMGSCGIAWDRVGIVWDRLGSCGDRVGSPGIVWDRVGSGGGPSGQAAAARLAIARALVDACEDCQPELEEAMMLYEDTRQRMPKMPGRMKARKQRQWSKR
ncbi:ribosomal protein S9 domain-containing protein, putative [Eimeria maxima]|uniref:Ribosomal protein S9 domain-containing protein, putative n=1 Tax=Eimeria maxima TaxID=5804 RepID=U6MC96_EIMMA|nr:ribosomal protein S9 domain-containing protein, putative [Eimeria maxima]CDJ60683.1 ribosomal protein S9 domain-containing protein, putative [Eimeria maxima]